MGGKSTPDFGDVAASQGEENQAVIRDQIYANRPTQYTPWGYTQWTNQQVIDPATGEPTTQWTQTSGLSPELQSILDKQIAIQGGRTDLGGLLTDRMFGEFGTPMDWGNLSPMGQVPIAQFTRPEGDIGDPTQTRQRAEDMMYQQATSRLDPAFQGRRQALEIKLRNQGLGPEDAAWQAQMGNLGQQETDAYNQAMFSASAAGRDEAGQMFNQMMGRNQNAFQQALASNQQNWQQAMAGSQYANQIRQQQMAEAMQQRGFSLNEINALLSGQQVGMPQMPNFMGAGAAQPAPIYQGAVDSSNIEQMQRQGLYSGLAGLAGSGLTAWGLRG